MRTMFKTKFVIGIILLTNLFYIQVQNLSLDVLSQCKNPSSRRKKPCEIVDGMFAEEGKYPFFARIEDSTSHFCGGSLISSYWILTAGHCIYNSTYWKIMLGSVTSPGTGKYVLKLKSYKGIVHPSYNLTERRIASHDIGLIQLPRRVKFNDYVRRIHLPPRFRSDKSLLGLQVQSCGFGKTEYGIPSYRLLYIDMIIISGSECKRYFNPAIITPFIICAQGLGRQAVCHAQNLSVNDTLNYGKYYQQEEIWNRVAYGTRARRGQFPFFARVISNTRNGCGGSLISSLWVLTAGHCIYEAEHWYILLGTIKKPGTDNFTDDYTIVLSKTGIQHPNSKVSGRRPPPHDIGLVKLPKRLKFNAYMRPISLPLRINPNNNLVNLKVRSCGFGRTETGRDSNYLLYVDLIIISHKECRKYFLNSVITRHIVCAQGYSHESVALGDSGGPLFYYNDHGPIIVGIVSFVNTKGCTLGYPSGFTRVDPYLRWIHKVTGIWIPAH